MFCQNYIEKIKNKKCSILVDKDVVHTKTQKGVAPILEFIECGDVLKNSTVYDSVIGKAAAMLLKYAGVKAVYGNIMSQYAYDFLIENNIECSYGKMVDYIQNRAKNGMCPMEQAVLELQDYTKVYDVITDKLKQLKQKKIVVATKNQGKLAEIKEILKDTGYNFVSMQEMGIDIDVVEDADTFVGNATKKALEIMQQCGEITLADDSGLCVKALNNAPGVYSARYSGDGANDLSNNELLLKNMQGVQDRQAHFVCAMVLAFPNGDIISQQGEFHGQIHDKMEGDGGFGYDVLFYLEEYGMTSAQISAEQKNKISHRANALLKIKDKLKEVGTVV